MSQVVQAVMAVQVAVVVDIQTQMAQDIRVLVVLQFQGKVILAALVTQVADIN